ncbi:DUF885 domain-containing protein [Permianibacter aggregans]|uniref:Uncharacterized protein (DUF885 family) n=1 Tax=Permianibacter aggregans TaxID=1510150 RepID=A0A4R6UUL8_9GAMM|nr:DUF885 family protein [Permianibacter aggregans]QGX40387.1 DUF885 domain-containing protein [Permianibacter aggregans]TDQ49483.1 uncharacterized protein (DUF885 family) [Permianibacter aggregans]
MSKFCSILLAVGLLFGQSAAANSAEAQFKALYKEEWQKRMEFYPSFAASLGDKEAAGQWTDWSQDAIDKRLSYWQSVQQRLQKIPVEKLSGAQRINYRIFADQIDNAISEIERGGYLMPFNSDTQFWADIIRDAADTECKTVQQCQRYLRWLQGMPKHLEQMTVLMRTGLHTGYSVPQVVLPGRDASIVAVLETDLQKSPFLPDLSALPIAQQQAMLDQLLPVIAEQVMPAFRQFLNFYRDEYVPNARADIAATAMPNGEAFYQAEIYRYTTLDWSAEKIHQIGLAEVKRIRDDMEQIRQQVNFLGDLPAFLNHLRTDAQFFAKTERELLSAATYWAKKIDGKLPQYFGKLPRQPYGVVPVPAEIAPTYTTGRYAGSNDPKKAGFYWVNTSKLDQRPLWALPALTLHEAVPGHHLQNALAAEQGEQPPFRRYSYISAYGEGWALYAEHLGVEMGIYETPYDHFGRLVYEMWRAARLVVDTGMHAKGWSRDQALQFMRDNTALSEHEITTEIDRYISWPAQALSYKLGEIKIREIRADAEKALGSKFDLRAFHDKLLSLGSVPLTVLEDEMRRWQQQQVKKADA